MPGNLGQKLLSCLPFFVFFFRSCVRYCWCDDLWCRRVTNALTMQCIGSAPHKYQSWKKAKASVDFIIITTFIRRPSPFVLYNTVFDAYEFTKPWKMPCSVYGSDVCSAHRCSCAQIMTYFRSCAVLWVHCVHTMCLYVTNTGFGHFALQKYILFCRFRRITLNIIK